MMQVPTPLPATFRGALCLTPRRLLLLLSPTRLWTVELGVTITDAAVDGEATVVFCTLLDDGKNDFPGCGTQGVYRDTVIRRVTDVPVVGHPLRLQVRVLRYRCVSADCEREVFAHNADRLARRGWSTTRRCARYICRRLMIDRATVAAVAGELGLSWDTVNTIAMDTTQVIVAADTGRLDGVRVIGVDEHRWAHVLSQVGGTRPTRPLPAPPPRRHLGLLRLPRLQRPHRSHQRSSRSTAPQRPRIQKPDQPPNPLTTTLRQPRPTNRCTLNRSYGGFLGSSGG